MPPFAKNKWSRSSNFATQARPTHQVEKKLDQSTVLIHFVLWKQAGKQIASSGMRCIEQSNSNRNLITVRFVTTYLNDENRKVNIMSSFGTKFRIFFLSTVVTKIIKSPKVSLTEREVADPEIVWVPTRHGKVRCLITRPATDAPLNQDGKPPVYINLHGGAYLIGAPEQDTHFTRGVAGQVGAVVVNVDYTTAPKAQYPQAQEECFDVLTWVAQSGEAQGWDGSRISIGGGSAGAHLSLGVLELARQAQGPAVRSSRARCPNCRHDSFTRILRVRLRQGHGLSHTCFNHVGCVLPSRSDAK